jgi:hypothetical protein
LIVRCADAGSVRGAAEALGWSARPNTEGRLAIEGDRPEVMLARLAEHAGGILEAAIVRPKLEDAFVALTGHELRDAHDDTGGRHAAMATNLRARGRR